MLKKDGKTIKIREDFNTNTVNVFVDDEIIYSNEDYLPAAKHIRDKYNLNKDELYTIYYDYKKDYDRHFE